MVFPIYIYGSAVLKKIAKDIKSDYEGLEQLIEDMFETMYKSDGVGLAAPQIGKSIRLFIIDAAPMEKDDPSLKDFKKIFINPHITKLEDKEWSFNEGCLSVPTIREDIFRPDKVTIEYYDENFEFHKEVYDGIKGRIIQHEYDHLDGVLFVDRVSPIRKKLLTSKLNAVKKGKVEINYKHKLPK